MELFIFFPINIHIAHYKMADVETFSLPDGAGTFLPPNALPDADVSESILFLAQLDKAMSDLKDANTKIIAAEEVKFFRMASSIIAKATTGGAGDDQPYFDAIKVHFGSGVEGIKRLAVALKKGCRKKKE